jgi:hypothetical protein
MKSRLHRQVVRLQRFFGEYLWRDERTLGFVCDYPINPHYVVCGWRRAWVLASVTTGYLVD